MAEVDRDRYGRIVGEIYLDGLDVSAELVRQGYAWVYRTYANRQMLYELEREAKRGLWGRQKCGAAVGVAAGEVEGVGLRPPTENIPTQVIGSLR